ncbi:MarR family winged helix-turn-helix transcriptional regulator [Desulfovibrio sp. Huiquan2017]|uniref:MarR family winged helix-turn-helix transcriptional regulator n=1 Tax=Desulfovibrio sp. Huiquan2017 TaxID=2816861 RepID=UPI001A9387CF|nr:MarR family winged helix-turn-helix transcriptional regulator [Desulfovibrio sp. Huiquan2017]
MSTRTQIDRFRHFNRFYTNYTGLLGSHLYDSPVNLSEARVLFELDSRPGISARDLAARLGLDKGYLSRMLRRFVDRGWLAERHSPDDARAKELRLDEAGTALMAELHRAASDQAKRALAGLSPEDRARLLEAMRVIESVLAK